MVHRRLVAAAGVALASIAFARIEPLHSHGPPAMAGSGAAMRGPTEVVAIRANDNRRSAGQLVHGELTVRLEVREGTLHPEEDGGPSVMVRAFAEVGAAPQVPGPLIRVPQGTVLNVSIHNPLSDSTLTVHGLQAQTSGRDSGLRVPPRATREVRFALTRPGTYHYWGTTSGGGLADRSWIDTQLSGAIVVDTPGARTDDRVFVIGVMFRPADSTRRVGPTEQAVMVINGKSWPHTERLAPMQGDSVRWRWINTSAVAHPMHLHGFYFRVDTRGDGMSEQRYRGDERPLVVTSLMRAGETMRIAWLPARPGNWLFHCHFAFHVSHHLVLPRLALPGAVGPFPAESHSAHPQPSPPHRMAGLVLGINVLPARGAARVARVLRPAREIRLLAQVAAARPGAPAAFGYVVQQGMASPAPDSVMIPGPTIVLRRNEPVRITVVNHLKEATGVHWHGIELESFPDGVPGWSGAPGRIMPPIAPGDSFVAEFVPPRSGTFMYHTHANEQLQMGAGLYGALLVVDPERPHDASRERVILVGAAGPPDSLPQFGFETPGSVNGSNAPPPMLLDAGKTYRLRLININPDWRVIFTLTSDTSFAVWRPVAKDGADLPPSQRTVRPAYLLTGTGETADFEFAPSTPGELRLEVKTQLTGAGVPGWIIPIQVIVR